MHCSLQQATQETKTMKGKHGEERAFIRKIKETDEHEYMEVYNDMKRTK